MSIQAYITEAFAPKVCPADPPGMPPRAHMFQVPSDRMRDEAAKYARLFVSLVPEPRVHAEIVDGLHDLVVLAERRLCDYLEATPELQADGRTLGVELTPLRDTAARNLLEAHGKAQQEVERLTALLEERTTALVELQAQVDAMSKAPEPPPAEPPTDEPGEQPRPEQTENQTQTGKGKRAK